MEEDEQDRPTEWAVVPEDEYDALNDETFGGTGEEYSWEETQNLFEDLNKPASNEIGHANGSSNGWNRTAEVVQTPEATSDARSKETDYYDYENDNALEESISRLVLDDMEDTEDEEEARKMKLSRLGASSNFNTYFMPPQVATKHLHWLMDKELPGGSSLLGSSVWSMHPTTTPDEVPQVQQIQQVNITPNRSMQPMLFNSATKTPVRTNHISNDIDLLDSENNVSKFFGGVATSTPLNSTTVKKPVFKTVEEIERELLEGENTASPKPVEEVLNHSKPKILMAEDLERELIQESPMPTPQLQNMENVGRSPLQALPQQNQIFSQQDPAATAQTQTPQKHVSFAHPSNTNLVSSPNVNFGGMHGAPPGMNANAAINNFLMMEQQKQILLARQGLLPGPGHPIVHPGLGVAGPIPPQLAQSLHLQQQHQLRMLHLHPHLRGRIPLMMPMPPVIPPHMRPPVLQQMGFPHSHPGFRKQMTKTDDPYRGLMTEKDKQRLRNIQIIQLQNDHPFTTDYYNLMHKAKQAAPAGLQLLVKLYPKKDEGKQRSQYEPARFDNCLGKLQAVSALAPKRVIDTFIRVTECRNAPRAGVKVYRYLLLEIEKLYECLLTMEESDIRMSILCNADEKDLQRRSQNAAKVAKILMNSEKLLNVLSVAKGKMLVCRSLPLIDPTVRYKVLGRLLDIFPLWGDHEMEKAFPYLRHCILHSEIRDLLTIIGSVTDNQMFESLVSSKLGLTVLMAVFHQAEHLLTRCDQMLLEDIESHWTRKSMFGITAILVKNEQLPNPLEFYPNILHHIRRFAFHGTDVQILESIIQRWANAGISPRLSP